MLAVWNSRNWRTPEARRETLFHTILLLTVIVAPSLFALGKVNRSYSLAPDGITTALSLASLFLLGVIHGRQITTSTANRITKHWLASTLTQNHVRNEHVFAAILHGMKMAGLFGMVCFVIVAMTDLDRETVLMIYPAYFAGYVAACMLQPRASGPGTHTRQRTYGQRLRSTLPPSMQLQANRPIALLASVVITVTLPLATAAMAAVGGRQGPLIASAVTAGVGYLFCVAQLVPGTAALHGLLAWTGPLSQGMLGRLLLLPFLIALAHTAPALFASIYLGNYLLLVIMLTGIAASVVAFLIQIVGNLRAWRGASAASISVPQMIILSLIVALGPVGWIFLVWQAIWLVERARNLWSNPA